MDLFEKIAIKYNGQYNEEGKKSASGPQGKLFFDRKKIVIKVKGSRITTYSNGAGGAVRTADPIRINLILKKPSGIELSIFPKSKLKKVVDFFIPRKSHKTPSKVRNQFSFGGNKRLIDKLIYDKFFIDNIFNENIYIVINKKHSQNILLTPAHGLSEMEQFNKYVDILKLIESKLFIINENL